MTSITSSAPSQIVLLAASSVLNSYLEPQFRQDRVMQAALDAEYGPGKSEVHNWSDNGEYIARFLLRGTYDRFRKTVAGVDLFIIRYGLNDAKRMSPEEFGNHNERLIELLRADFPDARFIMETGYYVDYPLHYSWDRNQQINPYWDQARAVAQRHGFPLSDLYVATEQATQQGNWDLRIRSQKIKPVTVDASRDAEFGHDVGWFTDVHPNPVGVRLAVETQMTLLKTLFPECLPSGGRKVDRPDRSAEEYSDLLDFPPERMDILINGNPDSYQTATKV